MDDFFTELELVVKCSFNELTGVIPDEVIQPIVRCCNCKHHELMNVSYSDKPLYFCTADWCVGAEGDNPLVKPDGFCAWGERIES